MNEQGSTFTMPPRYLSVPGLENCLGVDSTSTGHTIRCLPKEKPSNCLQVGIYSINSDQNFLEFLEFFKNSDAVYLSDRKQFIIIIKESMYHLSHLLHYNEFIFYFFIRKLTYQLLEKVLSKLILR